jgi:Family of unknown function (DUF6526)
MAPQTYANHRQFVPLYHVVLNGVLALTLIGSLVNLYESLGDHQRLYSAALIVVLTAAMLMLSIFCRVFALKAQDRAIRAEENLRHFVLTGKLLPAGLDILQVVALRFASDGEFPALAERAAKEGLKPDDTKRAVQNWRADTYRV